MTHPSPTSTCVLYDRGDDLKSKERQANSAITINAQSVANVALWSGTLLCLKNAVITGTPNNKLHINTPITIRIFFVSA